ncbi:MAG: hypothetical protein PUE01_14025 [Clostridiaceae bacterium]|nr:hypothetical protein [Clostridiaceae bacterium]
MSKDKKTILNLFLLLCVFSFAVPACSNTIISPCGLYGEPKLILLNNGQIEISELGDKRKDLSFDVEKETNVFNVWIIIIAIIIFIRYAELQIELPERKNLVSLKVRMNN